MESAWREIREHLESEKQRVFAEIRNYPPPVPACDVQFNYLLEERTRIIQELGRVEILPKKGHTPEDQMKLIDEFIRSSFFVRGDVEQKIRAAISS